MKVNIICGGHALTGYTNIDPIGENDPNKVVTDFGNLDNVLHDSEATEILAQDVIKYIPYKHIPGVLYNWMKKLRINGRIIVGGYDIDEIAKSYNNKVCDLAGLNDLVYGNEHDPMALSSIVTMGYIKDLLENFGLTILKQRKNGYNITVEARREQ